MKQSYIFPGQGAQFVGMGKDLYDQYPQAKAMFEQANEILGFRITDLMFSGTDEDLKQTRVTQPAIFLHSVIEATVGALRATPSTDTTTNADKGVARTDKGVARNAPTTDTSATVGAENFPPDMVAGHSLGEFSALVVAKALSFEDGLRLVYARAMAMQKACEIVPSTMAAVLGLEDSIVEQICREVSERNDEGSKVKGQRSKEASPIDEPIDNGEAPLTLNPLPLTPNDEVVVVPANYNSPGQIVISGTIAGVELACERLKEAGAKRALPLKVGGAFHSPLMQPASEELRKAIEETEIKTPICPIYQNVDALPHTDPEIIKRNLILQLTAPVRWTQIVENMLADARSKVKGQRSKEASPMVEPIDNGEAPLTLNPSPLTSNDEVVFTEFGPGKVLMGLVAKIRN